LRYGKVHKGFVRSIIVIDSPGCSWANCKFCAVHQQVADGSTALQQIEEVRDHIPQGEQTLQIVSGASFNDYSDKVQAAILLLAMDKGIGTLILEQRSEFRYKIPPLNKFAKDRGFKIEWIIGLESISREDRDFLGKEPIDSNYYNLSHVYQHVNILYGHPTKSFKILKKEISKLLEWYRTVTINIYEPPTGSTIHRDQEKVEELYSSAEFQEWLKDERVDIQDSDPRAQSDFGGIDTFER